MDYFILIYHFLIIGKVNDSQEYFFCEGSVDTDRYIIVDGGSKLVNQ